MLLNLTKKYLQNYLLFTLHDLVTHALQVTLPYSTIPSICSKYNNRGYSRLQSSV